MVIAHLSVKIGKVGKAQPHAAYIARQGQYAHRLKQGEHLEAVGVGNLPQWAQHDPLIFWQAADTFERANGSTYREYEIALPRELLPNQRKNLLEDFIKNEIGNKHVYYYAIHNPKAVDGQEQPHAHLMFCERRLDGIERDPEQFFKRYNAKNPERGGAKKENTGKDFATRQAELKALRTRWEVTCNTHLAQVGIENRIDMRSYQERHIDREPEPKCHPQTWKNVEQRAVILEFRAAQQQHVQEQKNVGHNLPHPTVELTQLEQRHKHKQTEQEQQLAPENLARVYGELVAIAQQELKQAQEQADVLLEQLNAHTRGKPKAPTSLFSKFDPFQTSNLAYEKQLNHWTTEHHQRNNDYRQALVTVQEQGEPEQRALQRFEQQYPALAEAWKQEQEAKQQREAQLALKVLEYKQRQAAKAAAEQLEREQLEKEQKAAREQQEQQRQAKRDQRRKSRNNDRGFSR